MTTLLDDLTQGLLDYLEKAQWDYLLRLDLQSLLQTRGIECDQGDTLEQFYTTCHQAASIAAIHASYTAKSPAVIFNEPSREVYIELLQTKRWLPANAFITFPRNVPDWLKP